MAAISKRACISWPSLSLPSILLSYLGLVVTQRESVSGNGTHPLVVPMNRKYGGGLGYC